MKIAHILIKTIPFGGGIERCVDEVGPRLVQMGHEIVVYTMRHYGEMPGTYKGMTIRPMRVVNSRSFEKMTSSFLATWDVCLKEKADLVHYHSFTHQIPFVPTWFRIPVLIQGHGIEWERASWNWPGKMMLKLSEFICVKSATQLTVVSRVLQDYLKSKYGKDSIYIPNGANTPVLLTPNEITCRWGLQGRDYLLTAVRLVPEKGVHYLIEAYNGLATRTKLVIAGDYSQEEAYGERLRRMASGNPNIIFTGFVQGDSLSELMSNAYAFVLASELEGLPIALLEALSYGNICLASDIPENREALQGKGMTFKSRSVSDLRDKLREILEDEQMATQLRLNAADGLGDSHHWDTITHQLDALYAHMRHSTKP